MLIMAVTRDLRLPALHHGEHQDDKMAEHYAALKKRGVHSQRCFYCHVGFSHDQQFEIVHDNDDHTDMSDNNLKVGCELCHSVKHLDLQGRKMRDTGDIIWLPELTQADLNQVFWSIAHYDAGRDQSEKSPDAMAEQAFDYSGQGLYMKLVARKVHVPERLRSVINMAQLLKKVPDAEYAERYKWLSPLRYLPPLDYYRDRIQAGHGYSFDRIERHAWPGLLAEVMS